MAEIYNFYKMGQRYATEKIESLKRLADNIQKEYGKDARIEFEAGIVSTVPVYGDVYVENFEKPVNGTNDFGVDNLRNNSYFGGTGISQQFIDGIYNDPDVSTKHGR